MVGRGRGPAPFLPRGIPAALGPSARRFYDRREMTDSTPGTPARAGAYRVLARKYRPATFADMIGQDAMVRTLTNALKSGRLAHAFILTGVRGVGKTTTARIIALSLIHI